MTRRLAIVVTGILVAGATLACSSGDGKPSTQQCIDRVVAAINTLDLSHVDANDGLDESERSNIESQLTALEQRTPDLQTNGPCSGVLLGSSGLSSDQEAQILKKLKPEVVAVLGAAAASSFSSVGSSVN